MAVHKESHKKTTLLKWHNSKLTLQDAKRKVQEST